ncbi:MAG: phosphoribosyltransferase [Sphingobacteriales bacterium]|jgi:pyrimidine operon attenuation protein/uracil phosphoribosyltransferase|nr:phosphoribosyltransferase [Sphingobacteriales bacterium]
MSDKNKYILTEDVISKKLNRLSLEIIENNIDEQELLLVGIESNGMVLATRIKEFIENNSNINVQILSLSMDKEKPEEITLSRQMDFDNKIIIIIDDVTNSGRTLLYAMKPFLSFQPKKISTLVLVERSHTQFPISPDFKGLSLSTTLQEHIIVEVSGEKITGAYLS